MLSNAKAARTSDLVSTARLSPEHERELTGSGSGESAISREVVRARGYYTAKHADNLPGVFPKWQRRRGLVVPGLSPSGATSVQYKPYKPIPRKDKPGPKYETPQGADITLDVNPLMLKEVCYGTSELWITEGCKKVDALASWGLAAVGFVGVEMFAVPGTKGTEPLPCWFYVRLKGRTVIIAYDADARTNADVQRALSRLVALLEKLGAVVLVVYVTPVHGDSKAGVDDYKAAGGKAAELRLLARPFEPVDIAGERLARDGGLREAIAERVRYLQEMPVKTTGQNTRAAVVRVLTVEAAQSGKVVRTKDGAGVSVTMDRRTLAEKAGKSKKAVNKAIVALEDEPGALRVDNAGRRAEKAGWFVLPIAQEGTHSGSKEGRERKVFKEGKSLSPLSKASYDRGGYPPALTDDVPALRWSKVILYWGREKGEYKVVDHLYVPRLGEKRGTIIRHVLEAGGSASVEDLMERFAGKRTRRWDFRRRTLGPIVKAGVLEETGEGVCVTADWREALERERMNAGELEDAERQRQRHDRQRAAFRNRDQTLANPTPESRGPEETRRIVQASAERDEESRIQEQRNKAGTTAEVFVHYTLANLGRVRLALLRELWRDQGGNPEHVRLAIHRLGHKLEKLPEHDNEMFVFPRPIAPGETAAIPADLLQHVVELPACTEQHRPSSGNLAPVVELRPAAEASAGGVTLAQPPTPEVSAEHPLDCLCEDCYIPTPRYARSYHGGAS